MSVLLRLRPFADPVPDRPRETGDAGSDASDAVDDGLFLSETDDEDEELSRAKASAWRFLVLRK